MYFALFMVAMVVVIGLAVYGAITATQMEKAWGAERARLEGIQRKLKIGVAVCAVAAVLTGVMGISNAISSSSSSGSGSGSSRSAATCGYCGKTYYAGDAGGNYRNIARTRLCKRCYSTYKQGTDMLGN